MLDLPNVVRNLRETWNTNVETLERKLAEAMNAFGDRLDTLEGNVNDLTRRVANLETVVGEGRAGESLANRVTSLEATVEDLESRIAAPERDVGRGKVAL